MAHGDAADDAELIARYRAGDESAAGVLFARHHEPARRFAISLAGPSRGDDVASEAFQRVLGALRRGNGPELAFRPYLMTTVRSVHVDTVRREERHVLVDDPDAAAPASTVDEAALRRESSLLAQAFRSLPERWQTVLWHTTIEQDGNEAVAELLGIRPGAVAALAYRAREGLKEAYLAAHLDTTDDPECRTVRAQLPARARGRLSERAAALVDAHLDDCRHCAAVLLELGKVTADLGGMLAPALLGTSGAAALVPAAAATSGPPGRPRRRRDRSSSQQAGAASGPAGTGAVVATGAVAGGIGVGVLGGATAAAVAAVATVAVVTTTVLVVGPDEPDAPTATDVPSVAPSPTSPQVPVPDGREPSDDREDDGTEDRDDVPTLQRRTPLVGSALPLPVLGRADDLPAGLPDVVPPRGGPGRPPGPPVKPPAKPRHELRIGMPDAPLQSGGYWTHLFSLELFSSAPGAVLTLAISGLEDFNYEPNGSGATCAPVEKVLRCAWPGPPGELTFIVRVAGPLTFDASLSLPGQPAKKLEYRGPVAAAAAAAPSAEVDPAPEPPEVAQSTAPSQDVVPDPVPAAPVEDPGSAAPPVDEGSTSDPTVTTPTEAAPVVEPVPAGPEPTTAP